MSLTMLRNGVIASFIVTMLILLVGGFYSFSKVPPIPSVVTSEDGTRVTDRETIMKGQHVYQKYGLMDHGSVWGHGSLRGMDFAATSLHLMGEYMRDFEAEKRFGKLFSELSADESAMVSAVVIKQIKTNTLEGKELVITEAMADAFAKLSKYWENELGNGDEQYGFLPNTVKRVEERSEIASFFFWTAWASGTLRPGQNLTYTNNWPYDTSVGNAAHPEMIIWSVAGILSLLIVLGLTIFVVHRYKIFYGKPVYAEMAERIANSPLTPSQAKTAKYFIVVLALFVAQVLIGGLLAHYTVHPGRFFLDFVAKIIPYSLAKTYHLQLAIFWIAVSWMGSALYLGPLIGGKEPKKQGLLVDILFGAVIIVAVGSLVGEFLGVHGKIDALWFWLGHQGWEYLELGRLWQILLFAGLLIWLVIAYRALAPKLWKPGNMSALTVFYTFSAVFVVMFFVFGLFYDQNTHISVADYWRWFVVHIWVEGIFEFFAAATVALLLAALGLVTRESALKAAYLTAMLAFGGGIVGTAHHYFWYGGPSFWIALGAIFSSLEPIPLILLVVRAWIEYSTLDNKGKDYPYRWPLLFLIASSFWNFLGAGVFGFIINLPIVNYYEHGTYLTSNHGHTALFGTYGMLSLALVMFVWRTLLKKDAWNEKLVKTSFYGLNIGLLSMFLITLLPVGIAQLLSVMRNGLWFAKSSDFFKSPIVMVLGNLRIIPDLILILFGAIPLLLFLFMSVFGIKKATVNEGESIFPEGESPLEAAEGRPGEVKSQELPATGNGKKSDKIEGKPEIEEELTAGKK